LFSLEQFGLPVTEGVLLALDGVNLTIDEVLASVKDDLSIETTKASIASTMSRLKADRLVQKVDDTDKWTKAPDEGAFAKDGTQGVSAPNVPFAEDVDDDL
jgi:chromatin segregation and condensation protein Rec8/ScpA/Scc1 (kleisin family)